MEDPNKEPMVVKVKMALWQHLLFFVIPVLGALAIRMDIDEKSFEWTFTVRLGPEEVAWCAVVLFAYYLIRRVPWLIMGHRSQYRHWQWSKNQKQ
ncbi:MAG: hypothetical protein OEX81_00695 [Candidatus Pacebacteria bacterium]|nr:hypothetical protein [Candidatus Paceibacterota bacterium]